MKRLSVLLVDDEVELVFTLAERLVIRGFDAVPVTKGCDALKVLEKRGFDVVVLDVRMPGMDGLEVMKKIREDHPQVRILLLTGRGSVEETEQGIREGASDYLIKPIDINLLIEKMKQAVGD